MLRSSLSDPAHFLAPFDAMEPEPFPSLLLDEPPLCCTDVSVPLQEHPPNRAIGETQPHLCQLDRQQHQRRPHQYGLLSFPQLPPPEPPSS